MPHRRKPKMVGPPGLALPDEHAQNNCGSQVQGLHAYIEDIAQNTHFMPALVAVVKEVIGSEMKSLTSKLEDTCDRLERIELLLFQASFSDFEKIDNFISETRKQSAGKQAPECESVLETLATKPIEEHCCSTVYSADESSDVCSFYSDYPLEMLSGMSHSSNHSSTQILAQPPVEVCSGVASSTSADKSLHTHRLVSRETTDKAIARARAAYQAVGASIGQIGTLEDLAASISVGTLLETTAFVNVCLRGSDGARYRTAGPIIKVADTSDCSITFMDAAQQPALDRNGQAITGHTTMSDELFCVVGHSKLGGVQIAYSELIADK